MAFRNAISRLFPTLLSLIGAVGCGTQGLADEEALGEISSALEFVNQSYVQSNGGSTVERYADCGLDQVLTGVGARVVGDNVTDLTVFCRTIQANGTLGTETSVTQGGPSIEVQKKTPSGFVAAGFGAVVSSDNVTRIVLKSCPWNSTTKRIDPVFCQWISNGGGTSAEMQIDVHNANPAPVDPSRVVATGAGFTCSGDGASVVRMRRGTLN